MNNCFEWITTCSSPWFSRMAHVAKKKKRPFD